MFADIMKKNGTVEYHVFTNDIECSNIRKMYGDDFKQVLTVIKDGDIIISNKYGNLNE